MEVATLRNIEALKRINPQLFALWVGMASVVMLFGAFTSAYIVKQGAGNWLQFTMPTAFFISSALIVVSSILLHIGYNAYKSKAYSKYRIMVLVTTLLGIGFVALQYVGWATLFNNGVDLKSNVGGSFFYLITGMHALHVLGGIAVLLLTTLNAYMAPVYYNEKRRNRIEMATHFWHFLGALWIYLFIFLNVIR
jgi:cytochrome c oxidase subunit III